MAKVNGKQKLNNKEYSLYTGIGLLQPIAVATNIDQLQQYIPNRKTFNEGTIEIICKLRDGSIQSVKIKASKEDNANWYVNPYDCEIYYDRDEKPIPDGYRQAKRGEVDLFKLLNAYFNSSEVDIQTSFDDILDGNVEELNTAFSEMAEIDPDHGFKCLFYIHETSKGNFQSIYTKHFATKNSSGDYIYNKFMADSYYKNNPTSKEFKIYTVEIPESTEETNDPF